MKKYRIRQVTAYRYDGPVVNNINQVRLRPVDDDTQLCVRYDLSVNPPARRYWHQDWWGNHVATFTVSAAHDALTITSEAEVDITRTRPNLPAQLDSHARAELTSPAFRDRNAEWLANTVYTQLSAPVLEELATEFAAAECPLQFVREVMDFVRATFAYDGEATTVNTTAEEFYRIRAGVCQDFTHLVLGLCRTRGIPARYVSGYLYCGENSALRGDAAMHAWVEIELPTIGWFGIDPTNHAMVGDEYIRIAIGRDYTDIVPIKGVYRGGRQTLETAVSVHAMQQAAPQ